MNIEPNLDNEMFESLQNILSDDMERMTIEKTKNIIEETTNSKILTNIEQENTKINIKEIIDLQKFEETIELTAPINKPQMQAKEEDNINLQSAQRIIEYVAKIKQTDFVKATYAIADIFQKGGYLKTVQNRATEINGITFTKLEIIQAATYLKINTTLRALARALKHIILKSSRKRNIPGHLFQQYKQYLIARDIKLNEQALMEHSYYCVDFQINNPSIPNEVYRFLTNRTRNRNTK